MDQQELLELKISKFLRTGVLLAGFCMFIGWMSHLFFQGSSFEHLKTYQELPLAASLKTVINEHAWGDLAAYIGLAILISLPITRVFLTAFLFFKQKEYLLAFIATFVLIALAVSFTLGIEL